MDAYEAYLLRKQMGQPSGANLGDYSYGDSPNNQSVYGDVGAGLSTTSKAAEATPFPVVQAIELRTDIVGKALGAYGGYQDAEEQRKLQDQAQTHDWARQAAEDAAAEEERKRRALEEYGNYAGNLQDAILKNYGTYNSRIGR